MKERSDGRSAQGRVLWGLLAALLIPVLLACLVALASALDADPDADSVSEEGCALRFDHALHVGEAGMECADCHADIATLAAGQRAMPDHETCEGCHDLEDDESCGMCHSNPEEPEPIPLRPGLCEGFSHEVHARDESSCGDCHGDLTAEGAQPTILVMVECQECHLVRGGELSCGACHLGAAPLPADHDPLHWRRDHGLEAAVGTSDCESCHTQASCDACHQGVLSDGSPHGAAWLHEHWAEAGFGDDCLVCHETRRSCTECHLAMVPVPHEFGPGFANYGDGGAHADEAKAFPETCLICHDVESGEHTCARCHDSLDGREDGEDEGDD